MDARSKRLMLQYAAIISKREAAERLPMAREDAASWLRDQNLVASVAGREVVHWGAVCACIDMLAQTPVARVPLRRGRL